MPLAQVISSVVMSIWRAAMVMCCCFSTSLNVRHQLHGFVHGHHPRHAREHALHEEFVVVAARRIAAVADHHDAEVHVARREHRRGDADVGRAAGDHDGVDAAHAQLQLEIGLVERAPAVLAHDHVAVDRRQLRRDLGVLGVLVKSRLDRLAVGDAASGPCRCRSAARRCRSRPARARRRDRTSSVRRGARPPAAAAGSAGCCAPAGRRPSPDRADAGSR